RRFGNKLTSLAVLFFSWTAKFVTVVFLSDPPNYPVTHKAFGSNQQKSERKHIRKPTLDTSANEWSDVNFRKFFRCADNKSTNNRPRHRAKSSDNKHGESLQSDEGK